MTLEEKQKNVIDRLLCCKAVHADPFKILEVEIESCTSRDITKKYQSIALLIHPDKCKLSSAGDAFKIADDAYKMLSKETILLCLKRAHAKKNKKETEDEVHHEFQPKFCSGSSSEPSTRCSNKSERHSSVILEFGKLCKLALSKPSTDEEKGAEVERLLSLKSNNCFVILDVNPLTCKLTDVNSKFRKMAQALHPDKCSLPRVKEAFHVLVNAYEKINEESKLLVQKKHALEELRKLKQRVKSSENNLSTETLNKELSTEDVVHIGKNDLHKRKHEILHEQQLEAVRLGDEAQRKRAKIQEENKNRQELSDILERQRKEWNEYEVYED